MKQRACRDCKGSGFIVTKQARTIAKVKRLVGRRVACPCTYADQFDTRRLQIPMSEDKR